MKATREYVWTSVTEGAQGSINYQLMNQSISHSQSSKDKEAVEPMSDRADHLSSTDTTALLWPTYAAILCHQCLAPHPSLVSYQLGVLHYMSGLFIHGLFSQWGYRPHPTAPSGRYWYRCLPITLTLSSASHFLYAGYKCFTKFNLLMLSHFLFSLPSILSLLHGLVFYLMSLFCQLLGTHNIWLFYCCTNAILL